MTLAEVKRGFVPGQRYAVTNHYIDREDHPCYGTREVTIERVTTGGVWIRSGDGDAERIEWPKAGQIVHLPNRTPTPGRAVRFNGGGINQGPDDPFLTFVPLNPKERTK
jgi:hypothetical protein